MAFGIQRDGYNPSRDSYTEEPVNKGLSDEDIIRIEKRKSESKEHRAFLDDLAKDRAIDEDIRAGREARREEKIAEKYTPEGWERTVAAKDLEARLEREKEEKLEAFNEARRRYTEKSPFYRAFHRGISNRPNEKWARQASDMTTEEINELYGGKKSK